MDENEKKKLIQKVEKRYAKYLTGESILMAIVIICCLALGALVGSSLRGGAQINLETLELVKYDRVGPVGCESDSMGLVLSCGDKLYQKKVTPKQHLREGKLYIYNMTDQLVVHRLVTCLDENCTKTVFKGDNNHIGEIVNRDQIQYEVVMVQYD